MGDLQRVRALCSEGLVYVRRCSFRLMEEGVEAAHSDDALRGEAEERGDGVQTAPENGEQRERGEGSGRGQLVLHGVEHQREDRDEGRDDPHDGPVEFLAEHLRSQLAELRRADPEDLFQEIFFEGVELDQLDALQDLRDEPAIKVRVGWGVTKSRT